jgi:hypothetical protein
MLAGVGDVFSIDHVHLHTRINSEAQKKRRPNFCG